MSRKLVAATAFAVLVSACGGADSAATTTTALAVDPTTPDTTTAAVVTTTTEAATTTTTEPAITFASLDQDQQEVMNRICLAATDRSQRDMVGDVTILIVISGEIGLPALEEAWAEFGQDASAEVWDARLDATVPICQDIAWSPLVPTTTTTAVASSAAVTVQIGDFMIEGETEGCPSAEILAGEYWVGPNRDTWTDSDGEPWTVSMSVDASDGDLKWSFSLDGSQRWVSYHVNQSTFTSDVTADKAVFETIFNDQIASISGGKPDTAGTVTITCS